MHDFYLLVMGAILIILADFVLGSWRKSEEVIRKRESATYLKERGFTPQMYLPGIGIEDEDLHRAMDVYAHSGYIIFDKDGNVVGGIVPRAEQKRKCHLRLVVSNN